MDPSLAGVLLAIPLIAAVYGWAAIKQKRAVKQSDHTAFVSTGQLDPTGLEASTLLAERLQPTRWLFANALITVSGTVRLDREGFHWTKGKPIPSFTIPWNEVANMVVEYGPETRVAQSAWLKMLLPDGTVVVVGSMNPGLWDTAVKQFRPTTH